MAEAAADALQRRLEESSIGAPAHQAGGEQRSMNSSGAPEGFARPEPVEGDTASASPARDCLILLGTALERPRLGRDFIHCNTCMVQG